MPTPRICTWCGHAHDPEDGRCDSHAHVGYGRCPCPGDDRARYLLPQMKVERPFLTFDDPQSP